MLRVIKAMQMYPHYSYYSHTPHQPGSSGQVQEAHLRSQNSNPVALLLLLPPPVPTVAATKRRKSKSKRPCGRSDSEVLGKGETAAPWTGRRSGGSGGGIDSGWVFFFKRFFTVFLVYVLK